MTAIATISVIDAVLGCALALDPVQELTGAQNRGYFVDAINRYCGSPLGSAWCLNFCHYVGAHAIGGLWPIGHDGNCDHLYKAAELRGILRTEPVRGAIFLKMNAQNRADATHAGFVDTVIKNSGHPVLGANGFRTIEGNSNDKGSREGKAVVRLTRPLTAGEQYVFVEWAALVPVFGIANS
jgi:hypothetical protein